MKKILFLFCTIGILAGSYSCSNDFDLVDTWKDIPVVYGLLASPDTAHYVRVEKAFLDDETSAFDIAQLTDSLYYKDAVVTLVRISDDKSYNLKRVDGNLEGFQRDEGVFANAPNYLYKLKMPATDSLVPGLKYRIEINRGDDLPLVTGVTTIVNDLEVQRPPLGEALALEYGGKSDFKWRFNRDNAIFFNLFVDFYYTESIGGVEELKVFRWEVEKNLKNENFTINMTYKFDNNDLFRAIASNISESTGEIREFEYMEFGVEAGGQEIYDYIQVSQVNTGITGSQLLPNFTNMSEGFGIFSSSTYDTNLVLLKNSALDSLASGSFTKNLNFQ